MNAAQRLLMTFFPLGFMTKPAPYRAGTPKRLHRKFSDRLELRVIRGEVRYGGRVRLR